MIDDYKRNLSKTKSILNNVSPSFCLAKWAQVTLHLHNGRTHSCHHPATHKIPLEEIKIDPSALHNTRFKKDQRAAMIDGKRPAECEYCWKVEDLPSYEDGEFFSDRVVKSNSNWALGKIHEVINNDPYHHNINPSYVEVSFSNICNFKCSYCSPVCSSRWTEEVENQGPYPTSQKFNNLDWYKSQGEMPIHHKEHNPYVEAFWKWWPDLVKDLKVFRITGGEPLLANDTFKVLDFLFENPKPQLELAVNTNACVPDSKFDTFVDKANALVSNKKIEKITIYTSVDGHGKQAEYGRFGLDYNKWLSNIEKFLLMVPGSSVSIMSTTNIFSVTSYKNLLNDVLRLKEKYGSLNVSLDVSVLHYPHHQCVSILTDEFKTAMDDSLAYMEMHSDISSPAHFRSYETQAMQRLAAFLKKNHGDKKSLEVVRSDFYHFVTEHDRRRGTDFKKTFPELGEFYEICKSSAESVQQNNQT